MAKQKAIIFDSGTLINFSMNGLLETLVGLKKKFNGYFIISEQVKEEVINRPINIKKFELGALRVKQLLDNKVIELPTSLGISRKQIIENIKKFLKIANNTYYTKGEWIHLIDKGEASCFALSKILTEKGVKNVISIDERTARMLTERPENLEKLLENKLHTRIKTKKENYKFFKGFTFIRSSEIVYIAYKKGLIKLKDHENILDALLYAVKYKGCAISTEEIKEMKKL